MTRVVGARGATLAVATPAQAFVLAGLVRLGLERPVLVVTPTGAAASQLAHDLEVFASERGRRRRRCHRRRWSRSSRPGRRCPSSGSAPRSTPWGGGSACCGQLGRRRGDPSTWTSCRTSSWPRSRRSCSGSGPGAPPPGPVVVARGRPGRSSRSWWPTWWPRGYRRESIVEHRGELAVRGGIVDVFPSTADEPVRIDLWGDEVDRLTRFDVADQRSTDDLDSVELFGCRELVVDEAMRERAAELVGTAPWGRQQWERIADGRAVRRHGVLAALAGGRRGAPVRPAGRRRPGGPGRAPPGPGPGRRAARRGVGPGRRAGRHLGPGRRRRRPPPARPLRPAAGRHRRRRSCRSSRRPRGPTSRWSRAGGGSPSWGTGPGWPARSGR